MGRAIAKYAFTPGIHPSLPKCGVIVDVGVCPSGVIELHVLCDPKQPTESRKLVMLKPGQDVPQDCDVDTFVGRLELSGASIVLYIFDPERASLSRTLLAAIDESGFDVSCCHTCGRPVLTIPDGMPAFCDGCGRLEAETEAERLESL
jgi:hypothetical protein